MNPVFRRKSHFTSLVLDDKRHTERWAIFDRFFPSLLLIVIAGLQLFLVAHFNLSPWKGGGFGMFASIDSPGMRVVYAEGIDSVGTKYFIDLRLNKRSNRRIRCFPQEEDLYSLGESLIDSKFVPSGFKQKSAVDRLRSDNPHLDLQYRLINFQQIPVYRQLESEDPIIQGEKPKIFQVINIQAWKIKYDAEQSWLRCEPLSPLIEIKRREE